MSNNIQIGICAGTVKNDKLYFSSSDLNGLFQYDLLNEKLEFICKFENEQLRHKLHLKAISYKDEVWFIPYQGENVSCFNINTKTLAEYKVWDYVDGKVAFIDAVRKEKNIILTPCNSDYFLEINMENHQITQIYKIEEENKGRFRSIAFLGDREIGIATTSGTIVKSVNLDNGEEKNLEKIKEGNDKYLTMIQDESEFWYIPFNGKDIICMDINGKTIKNYELNVYSKQYYGGLILNKYLILFPFDNDGYFLYFNRIDNTFQKKNIVAENEAKLLRGVCSIESDKIEKYVGTENGYLLGFDEEGNVKFSKDILINREEIYKRLLPEYKENSILKPFLENNIIKEEDTIIDLDMFINLIS